MTQSILVPVLAAMVLPLGLPARQTSMATTPIPMPPDRVADSYAIYSSLIPLGETAGTGWPHELWLVRDATVPALPGNQPCKPEPKPIEPGRFISPMNPHTAVHPPQESVRDFAEILDDFDAHCRDIIALSPDLWRTAAPVRLLTAVEQQEFIAARNSGNELADKYRGARALYGFSAVFFNMRRTVAWCMPCTGAAVCAGRDSGLLSDSKTADGSR